MTELGQIIVIKANSISTMLSSDIGCLFQLQSSTILKGELKFGDDRAGGFWQYELLCKMLQDLLGDDFVEGWGRQLTAMRNVHSVERVTDSANGGSDRQ